MLLRIAAVVFIFICTAIAWAILGTTIFSRTYHAEPDLKQRVESSWGTRQNQGPPEAAYAVPKVTTTLNPEPSVQNNQPAVKPVPLALESCKLDVSLALEHRQKGLLWYSTYKVGFSGVYVFRSDPAVTKPVVFTWHFPADEAIYDGLAVTLNGQPLPFRTEGHGITAATVVTPGSAATLGISYRSQGLDEWRYNFGADVSEVRDFSLHMTTNFSDIDFPENALSATDKRAGAGGWDLTWRYRNLVSGYNIAMAMPAKLQPGPLAGEISYFAPVSLFFFFFVIFIITTLRGIELHPMNYFFLAAAFFSFHLLLAYLVDHVSIHLAFMICSAVSIALVVSYLRLVLGLKFAVREAAIAQFLYLVLFSYAFFFKGYTGLAVTIGAILTLFVAMQATGRLNWSEQFRKVAPSGAVS